MFEWQATAIARVLTGRADLPTIKVQQQWVDDRLKQFPGGGIPFIKIGDGFEGYFEALRHLAGEPKKGYPGHFVPKFDPAWANAFGDALQKKIRFWKKVREIAERHVKAKEEGMPYDPQEVPVWSDVQDYPLRIQSKM